MGLIDLSEPRGMASNHLTRKPINCAAGLLHPCRIPKGLIDPSSTIISKKIIRELKVSWLLERLQQPDPLLLVEIHPEENQGSLLYLVVFMDFSIKRLNCGGANKSSGNPLVQIAHRGQALIHFCRKTKSEI
jgi:hypothetical protein